MASSDHRALAAGLIATVADAGARIMAHYHQGAAVSYKADSSPVTAADRESDALIVAKLAEIAPDIPVISEESTGADTLADPDAPFFLVDPLDGTKEFVQQSTDFTVNIALIEDRCAVFGLVYAPAASDLYVTLGPEVAYRAELPPGAAGVTLDSLKLAPLCTRTPPADGLTAVASRSHMNTETERWLERLAVRETVNAGSSLKFCVLARGDADVYPRLSPTMEWDTAAGDAVLSAAGGVVLDMDDALFRYAKTASGLTNSGFVAWGRAPEQTGSSG